MLTRAVQNQNDLARGPQVAHPRSKAFSYIYMLPNIQPVVEIKNIEYEIKWEKAFFIFGRPPS